ncbi:MAG TPA: 30S ribosome-binding factor RbfA [Candidatus Limnocylindrales bacterium]|nr:30S ribosome-binding factor RbfA [Candidatus Limnocylindrales bacterium]
MTARTERIDELLRQEIGEIIRRDVDDPRIGFATITDVETAPDLRHARVSVSVIGQPAERKATLAALGHAMPFVRHELGKRLHLKRIPEFHLELDDSVERGTRVLHLLQELEAGRVPEDVLPPTESLPTPVARLHHEGDADEEAAAASEATKPARRPGDRRRSRSGGGRPSTRQNRR